jgi:basic membrane lipoprotein Med (substrate-binding protein (PBP1-ABC) superfamily)
VRAAAILAVLLGAVATAGCGGTVDTASTTAKARPHPARTVAKSGLRIGVVGLLHVRVAGAVSEPGTLRQTAGDALVVVSAETKDLDAVIAVADAHPTSHYALVGAPSRTNRRPNVAGLVLDDAQAALLGGVVAGLVAADQGGRDARVAWVGPEERRLAGAFARGTHTILPGTTVLRAWSRDNPASCKEAALSAVDRGAVVVMAHGGACAEAALDGTHEQNRVALQLSDFEFRDVAADAVVRDAVAGMYHGGEDLVFGASSGAIGIRRLDPRISSELALRARTAAQELASGRRPSAASG